MIAASIGPIDWLDSVDSTSLEAARRIERGASVPFWVAARTQTAGRGRRGRSWRASAGDLTASLAQAADAPPARLATLGFAASLAVADLFDAALLAGGAAERARLKWPNDVLIAERKAAGMLLEAKSGAVVLGLGLNLVSAPPREALEDAAREAVSLSAFAPPPTPEIALIGLDAALAARLDAWSKGGFAALREEWLARADGLGAPLTARLPRESITGAFADVDADGALVLETADGVRRIHAAEVIEDAIPPAIQEPPSTAG